MNRNITFISPCDGDLSDVLPDALSTKRKVYLDCGDYEASKPVIIESANGSGCIPTLVDAWGAVVNNTVVVDGFAVCIKGLSVQYSPSHGFVFLRGQAAKHEKLTAEYNEGDGFFFGSGGFGANSQVAWSHFDMLCSRYNKGHGMHIHGTATANRNWLNANLFSMLALRHNEGKALMVTSGTTPVSSSRFNYNQFNTMQSESNEGGIIEMLELSPRANTICNPHIVERDGQGDSIAIANLNHIFGGRVVGGIPNKDNNTLFTTTSYSGENNKYSYDRNSDMD